MSVEGASLLPMHHPRDEIPSFEGELLAFLFLCPLKHPNLKSRRCWLKTL
jgi:hypothetical protein